jgi:hypothetical protein
VSTPVSVTVQATKPPGQQLVDGTSTDPVLLANLDAQATIVVSALQQVPTSQSVPLTPGKAIVWPAGTPAYGYAVGAGTVTVPAVFVSPGGGQMMPSAADIAAQAAAGYRVVDFVDNRPAGVALDGAGQATVRFGGVPANQFWQVTRLVESCGGNVLPTMRAYIGPTGFVIAQQYLVSGSGDGLFDEADYPGDGLWVVGGMELVCQWTGGQAAGGTAYARAQYRLLQRG